MKYYIIRLLLAVTLLALTGCTHVETVSMLEQTSVPTVAIAKEVPAMTTVPIETISTVETSGPTTYKPQTIEITTENWDDYFEIVYRPDAQFNSFGELEKLYIYCHLEPKAEYVGRIHENTAFSIELSYVAGNQVCKFSEDYTNFELLGEFEYTKDVTHIINFERGRADLIARHKVDTDNNIIVAYCNNFKAIRATGELILKNQ